MGGCRVIAQQAAELNPRQAGHDQIGDDDVRRIRGGKLERRLRIDRLFDFVALCTQSLPEQGANGRTVVDDQYTRHGLSPSTSINSIRPRLTPLESVPLVARSGKGVCERS